MPSKAVYVAFRNYDPTWPVTLRVRTLKVLGDSSSTAESVQFVLASFYQNVGQIVHKRYKAG
jgi:hypothetical protein